jgi:hypothetical protein
MRFAGLGALLLGLLAGQNVAQAQFSFGYTRYGLNLNNPFIAQQQYLANLQAGRLAIASGQAVPAWLPYVAPNPNPFNPYVPPGAFAPVAGGYNPFIGANPYMPATGFAPTSAGTNPYAPTSGWDSSGSNPYSPSSSSIPYSPYSYGSQPIGPGFTLMGGADVLRATGQVWKDAETTRIMRQQYYQAKLDTIKKKFDLDMYIKANTPTFTEEQARITKQILNRIRTNSSPAEILDGRSLNFLLNDIAGRFHDNKAPLSEIPLDESVLRHLNIAKGANDASLGLLRNADRLIWPTALVEMLPKETRDEIGARAQALAQNAVAGKQPDPNAIRDLRGQIEKTYDQLVKKANAFDTPDYMAAQRFLNDMMAATRAISSGSAGAQVEFQQMLTKGDIRNLNDLVRVMVTRGWRFGPALASDEGAYRALHSALVSYDVALNQLVAASEP